MPTSRLRDFCLPRRRFSPYNDGMVARAFYPRLLAPPRTSFFLFGPRGTGKSTWARQQFPEAHTIDLLDESLYQALLGNVGLFAAELGALPPESWVIVDEIQRLPALLNEVHRHIDQRALRFALLGSSARKLKAAGTNLLAGRALNKRLYPFLPEELGDDFALDRILRYGSLPIVWQSPTPAETLKAYVQLYLREEIKAEAIVRNLPGFVRFLPVAALFHGQVLNVSALARDSGTSRTTVAGYLEILEDTLLAFRLPAFAGRLRVRERKHPKLFWIDPGLARAGKGNLGRVSAEERAPLLEGWVAVLLAAYRDLRDAFDEFFYWAPAEAARVEVDFLLRRQETYLAVEVKATPRYSNPMIEGLKAISPLKGLQRRILVYLGDRRLRVSDGIDILPLAAFLRELEEDRLWP